MWLKIHPPKIWIINCSENHAQKINPNINVLWSLKCLSKKHWPATSDENAKLFWSCLVLQKKYWPRSCFAFVFFQAFQIGVKSTQGPIDVFLCPEESSEVCSPLKSPQKEGVEEASSGPSQAAAAPSLLHPSQEMPLLSGNQGMCSGRGSNYWQDQHLLPNLTRIVLGISILSLLSPATCLQWLEKASASL